MADGGGSAFEGAVVSGIWQGGGSAGCTTEAGGTCSFTTNLNKKRKEATWTIAGIAASGYAYDPGANVVSGSISFSAP